MHSKERGVLFFHQSWRFRRPVNVDDDTYFSFFQVPAFCVCFFPCCCSHWAEIIQSHQDRTRGSLFCLWHWEMRFWCVSQARSSSRVFERKSYFKRRVEKSGDLKGNRFWRYSELDIWRDMGMRFNRTFLLDLVIWVSAPTIYLQLPVKKIKKKQKLKCCLQTIILDQMW